MNIGELIYKITGDSSQLDKSLKKSKTEVDKTAKATTKGFGGIKASFIGATIALAAYVKGITSAIKTYAVQEKADLKLRRAIKNTGDQSEETYKRFKDFASELQSVTTIGDESTQELISLGLAMGITTDSIEDATRGAIGLSKSLGIDVNAAMKAVALSTQGNYTMLERYIPALRGANTESEKAALLQKAMADGFKFATDEADSATGKLQQMQNTLGDVQEQIGGVVLEAILPFVKAIATLADGFQSLPGFFKKAAIGAGLLIPPFIALNAALGPIGLAIAAIGTAIIGITLAYNKLNSTVLKTQQAIIDKQKEYDASLKRSQEIDKRIEVLEKLKKIENERDVILEKYRRKEVTRSVIQKELNRLAKEENKLKKELSEIGKKPAIKTQTTAELLKIEREKRKQAEETYRFEAKLRGKTKEEIDEGIQELYTSYALSYRASEEANAKVTGALVNDINKVKVVAKEAGEELKDSFDIGGTIGAALDGITGGGESLEQIKSLTKAVFDLAEGFQSLNSDQEINAKDWITLIIQAVQALEGAFKSFGDEVSGSNAEAGRVLNTIGEVFGALTDIKTLLYSIIPVAGLFIGIAKNLKDANQEAIDGIQSSIDTMLSGVTEYADQLQTELLDKAINVWEEYAREVIRVNSGLDEYLAKQKEFEVDRAKRARDQELNILQDALNSELNENEKYLAQQRIDEIQNDQDIAKAQEKIKQDEIELQKKIDLVKLAIRIANFKSEIETKIALLEADRAVALAGTSNIRGAKNRKAARNLITDNFDSAKATLQGAGSSAVAGFELERQAITGELNPDDLSGIGAGINDAATSLQTPVVITLDGKVIAASVTDYANRNLVNTGVA